jgi:hypothetical protein
MLTREEALVISLIDAITLLENFLRTDWPKLITPDDKDEDLLIHSMRLIINHLNLRCENAIRNYNINDVKKLYRKIIVKDFTEKMWKDRDNTKTRRDK